MVRVALGFVVWMVMMMVSLGVYRAQLSPTFYDQTCPNALSTIRSSIRTAIARERRMAASLIRLHFHDCFVNGCDASILLEATPKMESEREAVPNSRSVRGYEVIEKAKSQVDKICPGVVSCADILTVAARDASEYVGGPKWTVKLGRRDSTRAFKALADGGELPSFKDSLDQLTRLFSRKGLDTRDFVALSGAHTIGKAQCFLFRERLYDNSSDIDRGFAATRKTRCPAAGGDRNMEDLDMVTPDSFDNNYYRNLMQKKGLLATDQVLFGRGAATDSVVSEYSRNPSKFASDFAAAMVKMADIDPLTGSAGQIRRICSAVN
ncbi:PREDICTED: peroxidase 5-like [Tarenaya hassleriana]|uniref:peroxidase 5-like n=1 Tax=Tarenaya hassleriana TaxID=28532 RepID=UPI00053C90B2|nr:PREDICTED: peroxidase 5-like [Tarenaya hassleriana]